MVGKQLDNDGLAAVTDAASEAPIRDGASELAALKEAVEALRRGLVDGDGEVLNRMLHERLTYSHSNGRVWTKEELLQNVGGKQRYLSISLSEQTVDLVGSTGIVRHTYDVVNNLGEGKTNSSHLGVLLCWVRAREHWKLLARSSTTLPE
jgi:hypothetical protein